MKRFLLLFCLLLSSVVLAQQGVNDQAITLLDNKLDELWETANAPGISLSVAFPNGETKTFTRGFANAEQQTGMRPDTKMLGGSTGKVFYSVVALQLVEEGLLTLDTPISEVMSVYPWFSRIPNAAQLTVRALMRHETGIPRYVFNDTFQADVHKDADRIWQPQELLSYIFDAPPLFEVGTDFAYSDTNYIILAMLIEKVTGNTLYHEVQTRVLDRAGLKNVVPQTSRTYANIAQGYNAEDDPFFPGLQFDENGKSRYNLQFEWAGGGLVITSHDLAVLGKKIYEGEMFDTALLKEYFKGIEAGDLGGQWGLGVHIRETPMGSAYGHSGFMPGYVTNMMYFEKQKFAIACQVNTSDKTRLSILRNFPVFAKLISDHLNQD